MMQDDPQDAATEAFEALRAEVTQLRAGVEGLSARFQEQDPADYAPTLGAMAMSLEAIERHPALQADPETYARQFREATELSAQQGRRELGNAVQRLTAAGADLERLARAWRIRREQQRVVVIVAAIAAGAGAMLWACLSGPIARVLPNGWNVPERMAAATLGLERWEAGGRLMSSANPERWARVVVGANLEVANREALDQCRTAAFRTGKEQRCTVTLKAVKKPSVHSPNS